MGQAETNYFRGYGDRFEVAKRASAIETSLQPRGLRREQAARYIGVSPSKFDLARKDGKIPSPRNFLGVTLYCRYELDAMFDDLPPMIAANDNEWDSIFPSSVLQ